MIITVNQLHYAYGEKIVLEDINLTIESGETVGIIGSSGGGKSTLLKLISGLYHIQIGYISIGEYQSPSERLKHVAMVMQSAMLFPSSIRDNITCGHDMDDTAIYRACEMAQLSDWLSTLPDGLDTFVGERGNHVSGGQAQRIAIARAIAKDAPVVLLDEPTSALDGDTGTAVMNALSSLTNGRTVLHVSHQPERLSGCSRVLRLEGGLLYAS